MAKIDQTKTAEDYGEDQIHEEARARGLDTTAYGAGWQNGYAVAEHLLKVDRDRNRGGGSSDSLIIKPGEILAMPVPSPGTRSVGGAAAIQVVQALKESGWDLEKMVIGWFGIVASLIVLGLGMKMIFGPELLAQGVAGFWGWFVQPG